MRESRKVDSILIKQRFGIKGKDCYCVKKYEYFIGDIYGTIN